MQRRRELLAGIGTMATAALAGCPGESSSESVNESADGTTTGDGGTATSDGGSADGSAASGGEVAAAAQLNVYRGRLYDAVALGRAGQTGSGANVAQSIFQRFEEASGEYGAHETLERTSESDYETFESALGELTSALEDDDIAAASGAADTAGQALQRVQISLVGEGAATTLGALYLGARAANARVLASAGHFEAAGTVGAETYRAFEASPVYDAVESADSEAYESFEGALNAIQSAASEADAAGVSTAADAALAATVEGAYAMTTERTAGTGHLATMQARGYDAAALAGTGGPGRGLAHATTLSTYRARVHDALWLADAGATEAAATAVQNVFAQFEGARAHEALEEADGEAYEGFEGGLESLISAIEDGSGVDEAAATVDDTLVTGIAALAGDRAPVLQASFFRARLADARERYAVGEAGVAATIAQTLFQRFEANELDFHETLEDTSEDLYHRFEEQHLASLVEAYESGDDAAVETHHEGALAALLEFEATHDASVASAAESGYVVARAFDAATVATLDAPSRGATIAQSIFQHFEAGAAGYHEALEAADHETYETFESQLGAIRSAAESDGDVRGAVQTYAATAIDGAYAIVGSAGGSNGESAASIVEDVFATFESARVHEALEEADHAAYEGFEAAMNDYVDALGGGDPSVAAFADATLRAQFAVAGAIEDAPVGAGGESDGESEATETSLDGGPNVVSGVPDDADHVVSMEAVAFEPAELTVSVGDTVAFEHVGGEAHSVTAREGELPDGASYWASGGFDAEQAAVEGWENGQGAVQSGQSYVHTFETAGEHAYYCIPHEAAGMEGVVVVEG